MTRLLATALLVVFLASLTGCKPTEPAEIKKPLPSNRFPHKH